MKTENGQLNNLTSNGEFRKDTELNQVRRKICALNVSEDREAEGERDSYKGNSGIHQQLRAAENSQH